MTEKGLAYIHYLDGKSITDPALSAQWELHMQHIREGEESMRMSENRSLIM